MTAQQPASFRLINGDAATFPLCLSVPHSGRFYPDAVLAASRLTAADLAVLEDRFCDMLIADCIVAGHAALVADVARAVVDLNRAADDMDVEAVVPTDRIAFAEPGRKARAGLGVVPTRLARRGVIWRAPLTAAGIAERISAYHAPYHDALAQQIARIYHRFGQALLIDVHSMPSLAVERGMRRIDLVVGDRFGATAPGWVVETLRAVAADAGLNMAVNTPYAGGHIVRTHARPAQGIYAVQIEFDRALYLTGEGTCEPAGTARLRQFLSSVAAALCAELAERDPSLRWPHAAE